MNDGGFHADDGGELVPRDTAERVLRLAIEMEARRGEVLTRDELFRIARDVGVHPEYVRRALEAERAGEREQHRRQHAVRTREPLPLLNRVMGGALGAGVLLGCIVMVPEAVGEVRRLLADGFQVIDVAMVILVVLGLVLFGGMGWMALSLAWDRNA